MIPNRTFYKIALTFGLSCCSIANCLAQEYEMRLIENSKTLSQAIAINSALDVIGTKEVTKGPSSSFTAFFRKGDKDIDLDPPANYSHLEPCGLSDNGIVVGYVSRDFKLEKSMLGFLWDSRSEDMILLEPIEADSVCQAQDISADGKTISGYSVGSDPPRMRPCVWERKENSKALVARELPSIISNNPFLQGGRVIVSPNGKRIAACIAEKQLSPVEFDNSLFVWERSEKGEWTRRKILDEPLKLKDMNDAGTMVGSLQVDGVPKACMVDIKGDITLIDPLQGHATSEAFGINKRGVVVGVSGESSGENSGPTAFVCKMGIASTLFLTKKTAQSAALGITDSGATCGYLIQENEEDEAAVGFIRIDKDLPPTRAKRDFK